MSSVRDGAVLAVVGMGFPLSQVAIRAFGRTGAGLVEGVAAAVLVRDVALLAGGAARRLERASLALLATETAAAGAAVVAGLPLLRDPDVRGRAAARRAPRSERFRRFTLGTMFGMESWRLHAQRRAKAVTAPVDAPTPSIAAAA
jgi:hypothetical protein